MKYEIEILKCEIIAAQDQALQTKYQAIKILQTETDSKCRLLTIWRDNRTHYYNSMPNIGKRTIHKETWYSVCSTTL